MTKTVCTDPDAYQWQRVDKYGYVMRQVISFDSDAYAVLYGFIDAGSFDDDDVEDIAGFFGYDIDTLLDDEPLLAECFFEYYMDSFTENPYGPSPIYRTPEEACKRCDELMGESHEDMWLASESN